MHDILKRHTGATVHIHCLGVPGPMRVEILNVGDDGVATVANGKLVTYVATKHITALTTGA